MQEVREDAAHLPGHRQGHGAGEGVRFRVVLQQAGRFERAGETRSSRVRSFSAESRVVKVSFRCFIYIRIYKTYF